MAEERMPIGMEAQCWGCSKIWNISLLPSDAVGVKCSCGNYVVTPSGKVMSRPIYDHFDSSAPLLELDTYKSIILTEGETKRAEKRIILPGEE